jgi:hypothetical protein
VKYFIAVAFVWIGCTLAWLLLGSTLVYRSGTMSNALSAEVDSLWGPPLEQRPPRAIYLEPKKVKEKVTTYDVHGKPVESEIEKEVEEQKSLPLRSSIIGAKLELAHRQKGLLWFPTYEVGFEGDYEFHNDTPLGRKVDVVFPLGDSSPTEGRAPGAVGENVVYDGFTVTRSTGEAEAFVVEGGVARFRTSLEPGERRTWKIRYRSRGRSEWRYRLADGTGRVERFALHLGTNFTDVNFPAGTLSPTKHAPENAGWRGEWRFDSLISSAPIGIELPQRLNPGPLASRMTFFAPVGLLFFFFVVAVLSAGRRSPLHPMHYFFLGCSFFAFHLLFAYLVDHLQVMPSFAIAAIVALLLVVSYVRHFRGLTTSLVLFGLPGLVYLVLFSSSFFWEGYTGLAIAVLAVLTLFVIMQITGRVRWEDAFAPKRPPEPFAQSVGAPPVFGGGA